MGGMEESLRKMEERMNKQVYIFLGNVVSFQTVAVNFILSVQEKNMIDVRRQFSKKIIQVELHFFFTQL